MRLIILRVFAALTIALILTGGPRSSSADSGLVMLADFPTLKQQHSLTCEASAASMGTRGALTETQLMAVMPHSPNPNVGFRGSQDGVPGANLADYGVYAAPLQRALTRYGYASTLLMYATRKDIMQSIDNGHPVVAWVTYALQPAKPRLGMYNGVSFILVPHEHAVLIIGYDANTVIANDPWTSKQVRYYWNQFERSWGLFGNMALAMEPCPAARQVGRITVSRVTTAGLTWSWNKARNAAQYDVTVTRQGAPNQVLFHDLVQTPTFTLANPLPSTSYQIVVRSVSSCGGKAIATRQWYDAPAVLPTPVPTATVAAPSPSPTASAASPTATATPALSPTAAR